MRFCAKAYWSVRRTRSGICRKRSSNRPARSTRTRRDIEYTKTAIERPTRSPKMTRPGRPKIRRSVGSGTGIMASVREDPEEPRNAVHPAVRIGARELFPPAVGQGRQDHVFSLRIDITEQPTMELVGDWAPRRPIVEV